MKRCAHKWSFKECPECGFENDIAARNCVSCKAEIIDPNTALEEKAASLYNDPYSTKQSKVTMMSIIKHYVSSGHDMVMVKFAIEQAPWFVNRYFMPLSEKSWQVKEWEDFSIKVFGEVLGIDDCMLKRDEAHPPSAIMFRREKGSKYFNVKGMYWGEI